MAYSKQFDRKRSRDQFVNLDILPPQLRDYFTCLRAIEVDGNQLQYVPRIHIDYDMCIRAIDQCGLAIRYVPEEMINFGMICIALSRDPSVREIIPEHVLERNYMGDLNIKDIFSLKG